MSTTTMTRTALSLVTEARELYKRNDPYAGYSDDASVWRAQLNRTQTIFFNICNLVAMGCEEEAQELENLTQIKRHTP